MKEMTTEDFSLIIQYMKFSEDNACLSGGALGSDRVWGEIADKHSHEVLHFSFEGHNYKGHDEAHQIVIPELFLDAADAPLIKAAKSLSRRYSPKTDYVQGLLRRNYYQICYSKSIYAVTTFNKHNGIPEGGTSWAIQMFIDKHMRETPFDECHCYVLDKSSNLWYQYYPYVHNGDNWILMDEIPPQPQGMWTGVGSREINDSNIEAMEALWKTDTQIMQE